MIWLQRDPLGQIAGPDEYAYCDGEPRDFYDPMGLWGEGYATRQIDKGNVAWGWAVGIAGGAAEGAFDGWLMAHDNIHFGLTPLHKEAEKVREEHAGETAYIIGDGASVVAREAAIAAATSGAGTLVTQGRLGLAAARAAQAYEIVDTGINLGQGVANVADGNYTEGGIQILAAGLGVAGAKAADDAIDAAKAANAAKKAADDAAAAAKGRNAPTTGGGCPNQGDRVVIGKMKDLEKVGDGERTLIDQLPHQGDVKLNWEQNSRVLRTEMAKGQPIRDASVDAHGNLVNESGFLRAERELLRDHGWTYDPGTQLWTPPK